MAIVKWTPFLEPFEDADFPSLTPVSGFIPSLDIYQNKSNVIVEAPLTGVDPSKVKITVANDVLTIEGHSHKQSEVDEKNYYRKEVRYGSFHRSISLPLAVNGDKAKAEYEEGILKITIPKIA